MVHPRRKDDELAAKAMQQLMDYFVSEDHLVEKQPLFAQLKTRFDNEIVKGTAAQFVEAKLGERDERHKRVGDSRYQLEPNVKEGKGGLRDLHTLYWLAKYIYRIDDVERLVELKVLSAVVKL